MDTDNDNGGGKQPLEVSQMILTLDRAKFILKIDGHTENFDEALAILDLARRNIEGKIRAEQVARSLAAPQGVTLPNLRGRH